MDSFRDSLAIARKKQEDKCFKCFRKMYFGNEKGIVTLINVGRSASPDRINNNNIFYDLNNFNLVCLSCNFVENQNGRTFIEHPVKNDPIALTRDLIRECKEFLIL